MRFLVIYLFVISTRFLINLLVLALRAMWALIAVTTNWILRFVMPTPESRLRRLRRNATRRQ